MLQSLREKFMGWPGVIIFGGLGLLMAVAFGVGSYSVSNRDTWVAKVGKHEISQESYQQQMNKLREQMSARLGDQFDPAHFEQPAVKLKVVDGMIDRYLVKKAGADLGLVVTTAGLRSQIASTPAFQTDGKFDPDTYRAVLASNGMTPLQFQQQLKTSLETRLLPEFIADTTVVPDADVAAYLQLQLQTRDIAYLVLPRPKPTDTKVSETELASYYKAHKDQFVRPEQVSVNYIELDASKLKLGDKVDEAALKARYQQEISRFTEPGARLVSHILIALPANATAAQRKQALAKAEKVDKLAHAKGSDFAALAKQYSDDAGSKLQGGNLGWLQKGVTGEAFQKAVFSMTKGEISAPVLTPEGYHIIWLRDIRPGKVKPFDDVRAELAKEVEKSERAREYSKVAGKLTDLVYRNPTSLEPAAKELGLTIEHTGLFGRSGTKSGLASNPAVVKAAFSANVLTSRNTSDPISLGTNHMVVIHLAKHEPSAELPLDKVTDKVRQKILDARTASQASARADSLYAKLGKGHDLDKLAAGEKLKVKTVDAAHRTQKGVPQPVLAKAFAMPQPGKDGPRFAKVSLGDATYALVELKAVHPGDPDSIPKAQRQLLAQQIRGAYASEAAAQWLDMLKSQTTIKLSHERM